MCPLDRPGAGGATLLHEGPVCQAGIVEGVPTHQHRHVAPLVILCHGIETEGAVGVGVTVVGPVVVLVCLVHLVFFLFLPLSVSDDGDLDRGLQETLGLNKLWFLGSIV